MSQEYPVQKRYLLSVFSFKNFCIGARQPYTTPTKGFQSKRGIFEVVVYKLSEPKWEEDKRATTNVQNRFVHFFYYLFFSFVLIELKPFVLKGKVLGEKLWESVKNSEKVWKSWNDFAL